jgi:hypothetical protein
MTTEQLWVIAYDSPSNKRRRKLAKLLEGYGERLQWSVFECRLQPHQLRRLMTACVSGWCRTGPRRPSSWGSRWKPQSGKTR